MVYMLQPDLLSCSIVERHLIYPRLSLMMHQILGREHNKRDIRAKDSRKVI